MMITAQQLYDRRDERGEIDGSELHEIFRAVCDGEPSPAGRTEIDSAALMSYAASQRELYAAHKTTGGVGGEYLLERAAFCDGVRSGHMHDTLRTIADRLASGH